MAQGSVLDKHGESWLRQQPLHARMTCKWGAVIEQLVESCHENDNTGMVQMVAG